MRELCILCAWLLLPLLVTGSVSAFGQDAKRVRPPARAGQWYERRSSALATQVDQFLRRAPTKEVSGHLVALIEPHAGYTYSGMPAAAGFKLLSGKNYTRVILLGVPHFTRLEGCSVPNYTHYQTPLGEIPLDREAGDMLLKSPVFRDVTRAHEPEHSIEAELPFLQRTLSNFSIVPVLVGDLSEADRAKAANALRDLLSDDTLIVVSSDFTHYGADFGYLPFHTQVKENLDKLDHGAVEHILKLDADGFTSYVQRTGATICGRNAIALLLDVLKPLGDVTATEVAYTTSGDLTGDWSHCVSYCTIAFSRGEAGGAGAGPEEGETAKEPEEATGAAETRVLDGIAAAPKPPAEEVRAKLVGPEFLSPEEQQVCLKLARQSLEHYYRSHQLLEADVATMPENLREKHGCFVTLKKEGQLRGCIGRIVGDLPLYKTIVEYAVHAAIDDPRFQAVTANELSGLDIEVSVMTPLERVGNLTDIQVGRDGLLIKMGFNQGLLLPQVATEYGWDRDTFLAYTCRKAGLPMDAWKSPQAELYRFSAQVFGEEE